MSSEAQSILFRWLTAIAFFGLAFWAAKTGFEETKLTRMVLSVPLALIGLAMIFADAFRIAITPFTAFIDAVFMPKARLSKPTLNLKLPRYYVKEERYEEALDSYREIIRYYPDETEAYEQAIWLYREVFDEPKAAERLLNKARRRHLVLDSATEPSRPKQTEETE